VPEAIGNPIKFDGVYPSGTTINSDGKTTKMSIFTILPSILMGFYHQFTHQFLCFLQIFPGSN